MNKEAIIDIENPKDNDLISRQEAVEAFQMFREYESNRSNKGWVDRIETVLNQLSPVNTQPKCEDIAKAFQLGLAFGFGEKYDEMDSVIDEIKKVITPQPKTGHWEKTTDKYCYYYKCSCCGTKTPKNEWGSDYFSPYCPECGIRMVELQESEDKE